MAILGIRCSTNDYAFAALTGDIGAPGLEEARTISFPAKYSQPEKLKWLLDELQNINRRHAITEWAIKSAEPMAAKGSAYAERVELEAMVSLSAAMQGEQLGREEDQANDS